MNAASLGWCNYYSSMATIARLTLSIGRSANLRRFYIIVLLTTVIVVINCFCPTKFKIIDCVRVSLARNITTQSQPFVTWNVWYNTRVDPRSLLLPLLPIVVVVVVLSILVLSPPSLAGPSFIRYHSGRHRTDPDRSDRCEDSVANHLDVIHRPGENPRNQPLSAASLIRVPDAEVPLHLMWPDEYRFERVTPCQCRTVLSDCRDIPKYLIKRERKVVPENKNDKTGQ